MFLEHGGHHRGVVDVPSRDHHPQRPAAPIGDEMQLGGQPATRAPNSVVRRFDPRIPVIRESPLVPLQCRAVLMHARDRGIDRHNPVDLPGRVCLLLHLSQQLLPGAILRPPGKPLVDRVPLPEPLRHIPPRRTRAVFPRHPLDREPVIRPRPRTPRRRRHQRLHHSPHLVRDLASRHHPRLARTNTTPLDQRALGLDGPQPVFFIFTRECGPRA